MIAQCETPLPVVRVAEIPDQDRPQRWLVDQLWGASSVGLIGGAPKCSKTWLGLDLALSVATGTACLGNYAVPEPGPVLVYLAEDALPLVRQRVDGMARHRGLSLQQVEIHVITAPTLRLDRQPHRKQLFETAQRLGPRLLLLDPLVRLHGIDENHAGVVSRDDRSLSRVRPRNPLDLTLVSFRLPKPDNQRPKRNRERRGHRYFRIFVKPPHQTSRPNQHRLSRLRTDPSSVA